ncbi:hypothetical protein Tco_0204979 [Tanacetum coccineum]
MDDLETTKNEDVVNGADHPQDIVAPNTDKSSRDTWFKQPPRPPTLDPEWNKRQVVIDQPEQPWFNHMVSAVKDPLTFDELMATPIDFSKRRLLPPDLTKPLHLKGRPGRLTVAVEYFFNNDLEFLKLSDPEMKYTTSITKTKAARYEIVGIEDMVYKFNEGDFVDLHLNDIEDMLLLAVQHKLFQLDSSDIVDLIVALRMFTRSLIIKCQVEDLQLGVESYQKKLNITGP